MKRLAVFYLFFILLLGGCTNVPTPAERRVMLDTLVRENHLQPQIFQTTLFSLYSLSDTRHCENRAMRVYIEGDGFAWVTRSRLSNDPTPINPLSAKLMTLDPSECKVYLARPCQYTQGSHCDSKYWSSHRFSPEVIQSYDQALDYLRQEYKIESFTLIGYSGGGAVAALSAAGREDVKELITIAGNIDTDAWVNHHGLSPLEGSLNPAVAGGRLSLIPQTHLIGSKDTIIPPNIFESYRHHFTNPDKIKSVVCKECTHNEGWVIMWERFLKK